MKEKITLAKLKKKYPHPVPAYRADGVCRKRGYCVGGALCRYVGVKSSFPSVYEMMDAIKISNPIIEACRCLEQKLSSIAADNDAGRFRMAWSEMGKLLRWKPGKRK